MCSSVLLLPFLLARYRNGNESGCVRTIKEEEPGFLILQSTIPTAEPLLQLRILHERKINVCFL